MLSRLVITLLPRSKRLSPANFVIFQSLQNYPFKYVKCTGWTIFRANIVLIIDNIEFNLSAQVQVIAVARDFQSFEDTEGSSFRSKQIPKVSIYSFTHKILTGLRVIPGIVTLYSGPLLLFLFSR